MPQPRRSRREIDYSQFCDVLDDFSGSDDDYERSPSPPPVKKIRAKPSKTKAVVQRKRKSNEKKSCCKTSSNRTTYGENIPVGSPKVTLSTVKIYEYQDRICLMPTQNQNRSIYPTKLEEKEEQTTSSARIQE